MSRRVSDQGTGWAYFQPGQPQHWAIFVSRGGRSAFRGAIHCDEAGALAFHLRRAVAGQTVEVPRRGRPGCLVAEIRSAGVCLSAVGPRGGRTGLLNTPDRDGLNRLLDEISAGVSEEVA